MSRSAPATREDFKIWWRFATRWADNDAYGHVNNTVYYEWFDSAVNAWLVDADLLDIAGGDIIALVVETGCTYRAPLAFPGDVEVGLAVAELGQSSVRYRIGIFAPGTDSAAADGFFVHVAVDRTGRRPVPWPEVWRAVFDEITLPRP